MNKPTATGDSERPASGSLDKNDESGELNDLDEIAPVYRPDSDPDRSGNDRGLTRLALFALLGALILLLIFGLSRCGGDDGSDLPAAIASDSDASESTEDSDPAGEIAPDDTAPEDTASEDTASEDAPPDDTPSDEPAAGNTTSDDTASGAWIIDQPTGAEPSGGVSAAEVFGPETWVTTQTGGLHRYTANATWTQRQDPLLTDLVAEDLSADQNGLTVLVTEGELGAAIGVAGSSDEEFAWQPFELPPEASLPNLLASGDAGHLVSRSDGDPATLLRNAEAEVRLRDGGIDLGPDWIAGADTNGVTYLDPNVPLSDWSSALPTTTSWSAFGIDEPDWFAYGPPTEQPQRLLFLVTSESVIQIGDPFGPREFLVELNANDGAFEAITWDGSAVNGPTLWTSNDAENWRVVGPTLFSGTVLTPAIDGASIAAGEHEYRLRTLGTRASVLDHRTGNAEWSPAPLSQLAGSTLSSSYVPDGLMIGPAALALRATHVETDKSVLLLSRDGENWQVVDPDIEIDAITIADTYVLVTDTSGATARLTPTS